MSKVFEIDLISERNTIVSSDVLNCYLENGEAVIRVKKDEGRSQSFARNDFFSAFSAYRRELWKQNLRPACMGACLYVFPSGMSRDMGLGEYAYFLRKGDKATPESMVNIFEPLSEDCSYDTLVSVEEQEQYRLELVEGR